MGATEHIVADAVLDAGLRSADCRGDSKVMIKVASRFFFCLFVLFFFK